jgi:hypothetical protein
MTTPPASSGVKSVVLLVDESAAMQAVVRDRVADGGVATKTNAERVATAINGLIKRLGEGSECEVALIGYGADKDGRPDVGLRWSGGLAGREFVGSHELLGSAVMEKRTRKVPQPNGNVVEESVDFPVWYEPRQCSVAPQTAGLRFVTDLLARRAAAGVTGQPIVVHVFGGSSSDGSPQIAADELLRVAFGAVTPLLVQCHVASAAGQITSSFPVQQGLLPAGVAQDLFSRASSVPDGLRTTAAQAKMAIPHGARAIVHNAKMMEVVRCLELARWHVVDSSLQAISPSPLSSPIQSQATPTMAAVPPAGGETPSGMSESASAATVDNAPSGAADTEAAKPAATQDTPTAALAVLVLDRSAGAGGDAAGLPFSQLQDTANDLLRQLSSKPCLELPIDVAIVSYGVGADGQVEVSATFAGPLAGRECVRNTELTDGAIRIAEKMVEMSNGAGGILSFTRRTPIHFDLAPSGACPLQPAFAAVAGIVEKWRVAHADAGVTIVVHLTRAGHDVADVHAAADVLAGVGGSDVAAVRLQHCVCPDSPHASLSYPATDDEITSDAIRALWQRTSPLADWEKLRGTKRAYIKDGCRALVVNGSFDTLAEELAIALAPARV